MLGIKMILSFNLEYFGECNNVISFYSNIFDCASVKVKKYKEMPTVDILNIKGRGLDMIWNSTLTINFDNRYLNFEMSDSILVAMQREISFNKLLYNPLILLTHNNDDYIRNILNKIYNEKYKLDEISNENIIDCNGIRWSYQKNNVCGIFYCLEFDGFCTDVIKYYENAFEIKSTEIIRYADSPFNKEVPFVGRDKIYSAILKFQNGNQIYALKLSDSLESALKGSYGYDPNDLLFYQKKYNPIFTLKDSDAAYLSNSFDKLMVGSKLNRAFTHDDEGVLKGSLIDKYGICWNFIHC